MTKHGCTYACVAIFFTQKVVLKNIVCDLNLLDWFSLLYGQRLNGLVMLWPVYDHVKLFYDLNLNYNLVVCSMHELCYFLAYKVYSSIGVYSMVYL